MRQVPRGGHLAYRLNPRGYITPGSTTARARADLRWLYDPTTQQYVVLVQPGGGWDINSFAYGLTPPAVTGDVLIAPLLSIEGYPIVLSDDGVPEVDTGGDSSRQTMYIDIFDVSLGAFYGGSIQAINDLGPTFSAADKNPLYVFSVGVATQTDDLSLLFPDPEGDAVTVTFDPTYTVPSGMTIDISNKINFNSSIRQVLHVPVVGADPYGLSDTGTIDLIYGPVDIPDVSGQTPGAADALLTNAYLNRVPGTPEYSATVLSGFIIRQSPTSPGTATALSDVTTIESLGTGAYLTLTEANDALTSGLTHPITITFSKTEAADTLSSTASGSINAVLTKTEANDTLSAATTLVDGATLSTTEANDTISAAATVPATAASAITESNDSLSATGAEQIQAALTKTETNDSLSATSVSATNAAAAIIESGDSLSANAITTVAAAATLFETSDTLASTGTEAVAAAASLTEANDTLAASSGSSTNGAAAIVEQADALTAASSVPVVAAATMAEANDTLSATTGEQIQAALSKTEAIDTLSATVIAGAGASLSITEAADALAATGVELITFNASIVEGIDTARAGYIVQGVTPTTTGFVIDVLPTEAVTVYAVALSIIAAVPSAAQIAAGHDGNDLPALAATSLAVGAGASATVTFAALDLPLYNVYVVGKNISNVYSAVEAFEPSLKLPAAGRQYIQVNV